MFGIGHGTTCVVAALSSFQRFMLDNASAEWLSSATVGITVLKLDGAKNRKLTIFKAVLLKCDVW
jgi:hypothetical protein